MKTSMRIAVTLIAAFGVLFSTLPLKAEIPNEAQWIVGNWEHEGSVRVKWSFQMMGNAFLRGESHVTTLLLNKPLSTKISFIYENPFTHQFKSKIFEIEGSGQTGTVMEIDWSTIGPHWNGELSGHKADGKSIEGKVELDRVSDNEFTYRITDFKIGNLPRPNVDLTYVRH